MENTKNNFCKKRFNKGNLIIIIAILFISLFLFIMLKGPKEVATVEQVWSAIDNAAYHPAECTYLYSDELSSLEQCIGFQYDDVYFNFYVLDSNASARNLYGKMVSHVTVHYFSTPNVEYSEAQFNYCIYSLTASGRYSVVMYVGNTVVYAYCNEGNNNGIVNVLKEIAYFD